MATIVCPSRIRRLFKGGAASEAQKRRARVVALAWVKQAVRQMRPDDKIMIPNPNTGELEEWARGDEALLN